jgi:hypothetical protein
MKRIFADLFGFGDGICHLRVYSGRPSIALAVEVEDNPGGSTINRAELLRKRVGRVFDSSARVFSFYPDGNDGWTELLDAKEVRGLPFRTGVTHAEIESLVGTAVELPDQDGFTAAALAGSDNPLLSLLREEPEYLGPLGDMGIVAVGELPWAHKLSKCAHAERFEVFEGIYEDEADEANAAGAHFFLSLDQRQLEGCIYHHHDWKAIAAASVELLEGLEPTSSYEELVAASDDLLPPGSDRDELRYLFSDPIHWDPGATSLTNGQHRTCALKAAGAPYCAISTGAGAGVIAEERDPEQGARATLAAYWLRRLEHG